MKAIWSVLLLFVSVGVLAVPAVCADEVYVVAEGRGIQGIGEIGGHISRVQDIWGKADREAKEDMYITDVFHEYHQRGVLFSTDKSGQIIEITLYCNTGNKEQFHQAGLMWINPSSIYQTFSGTTSKSLRFKDRLMPEDVYAVYGKPEITVQVGTDVQVKLREGNPLFIDMGKAGFAIHYPGLGISFQAFDGMVESCTISTPTGQQ